MTINWDELYKVRIGNADESFQKHEIVKLLVVMKTLKKYKRKDWLRIYTEFSLNNGFNLRPDVYVENIKDKSIICFEIQKELSKEYEERKNKEYLDYHEYQNKYFGINVDLVIIPLKECPDNINEINKWLEKYVM